MDVPIGDAPPLAELVRRAAAGEEVVLTENGRAVARVVPMLDIGTHVLPPGSRMAFLRAIGEEGRRNALPGPPADRAADFLYGEDGLPR